MENNFANRFASFYAEHADTYADDMDLALEDFQGFESMESEYGFLEGVKNVASTAGSAIKTGAQAVGGVAKKVGSATGSVLKTASKVTGVTSLAQGAKRAAYGAAVGGTVNAVRGKSVAKGMGAGAAVGVVGGGMINKGAQEASNLYNKAKERFSDMDYSELVEDEGAKAFADFYTEMEDIYQDNMDEAFSDYIQLYTDEEDDYANKWEVYGTLARTGVGALAGAGTGVIAKGIHNKSKGEKFFKGAGKSALVGGVAGGAVGTAFGINRMKKERAFDKSIGKDYSKHWNIKDANATK